MSNWRDKIVKQRPDLIGRHVWFCPVKSQRLECIINDDGSISPICAREKKFTAAKDLIDEIANGSINCPDFQLPSRRLMRNVQFSVHLFMSEDSTGRVSNYVSKLDIPLPSNYRDDSNDLICHGFSNSSPILEKLSCSSIEVIVTRYLLCATFHSLAYAIVFRSLSWHHAKEFCAI